jgi:hypothetical protein
MQDGNRGDREFYPRRGLHNDPVARLEPCTNQTGGSTQNSGAKLNAADSVAASFDNSQPI